MTAHPIVRVSETYPTPALVDGLPNPATWLPSSTTVEEWGTLRLELAATWEKDESGVPVKTADGTDLTEHRGARTLVTSLQWQEPFGEVSASFTIPTLTPFDAINSLTWAAKGVNVDIWHVLPDGVTEYGYWHGILVSREAGLGGVTFHCAGALFGEASTRMHQPPFLDDERDIGSVLDLALRPEAHSRPLPPFRFQFIAATTGITTRKRGSRSQTVADFCTEALQEAQDGDGQWTIGRAFDTEDHVQPRVYAMRRKGIGSSTTVYTQPTDTPIWSSVAGNYPGNPNPWVGVGGSQATITASSDHAHSGTQSEKAVFPDQAGSGYSAWVTKDVAGDVTPVPGRSYTVSMWVWVNAGGSAVILSYGDGYPDYPIAATTTTTGAWERLSYDLPATGVDDWVITYAVLSLADPTLPTTIYVDDLTVAETIAPVIQANTVSIGGRGITHQLADDALEDVTTIYGEGVDPTDGSRWRNSVYPNLHPRTTPTFPGTLEYLDEDPMYGADWILRVQAVMRADGQPDVRLTGVYDLPTVNAVTWVQDLAGLPIDGYTIDADTWDAIWDADTDWPGATELQSGYFQSLATTAAVEPWLFYADGSIRDDNPAWNPQVLRVEQAVSYGEQATKQRARVNARHEITRTATYPGWAGSITLDGVSPEERCLMDIREGGRVTARYYIGSGATGIRFFTAAVTVNPEARTASLDVDARPYDLIALDAKLARNAESRKDPARSLFNLRDRVSKPFFDQVGWDRESGAGHVPPQDFTASGWHVVKLVGAQYGSLQAVHARCTGAASRFALALFGAEVTAGDLDGWVPDPLTENTSHKGLSWWSEAAIQDDLTAHGFLEAWGEFGEACGYWPSKESVDPTPSTTGKFVDPQSLSIASLDPPFLWLGVWTEEETTTFRAEMRITITE